MVVPAQSKVKPSNNVEENSEILLPTSDMHRQTLHWTEKPLFRNLWEICNTIMSIITVVLLFIFFATYALKSTDVVNVLYIHIGNPPVFTTNPKFLSLGLDTVVIQNDFKGFNMTSPKLMKLMKALRPAYLRIGGNNADRLYFSVNKDENKLTRPENKVYEDFYLEDCSNDGKYCDNTPNFTMSGQEWLNLMKFTKTVGVDVIFDLNALRRFSNGSWDYRNAETLINFSQKNGFNLNWELGNEPNAFRHKFDYEVQPSQMAKDFARLRTILNKYPKYRDSLLVGPSTTRPEKTNKGGEEYLSNFLKSGGGLVDAITWHHYYLNGRTATPDDFLDSNLFDILKWQIGVVTGIRNKLNLLHKPLWLGETASAYGGGAPCCSDRYISIFIWLDKLGLAAKMGLDVVVRQSIYHGYYALLDENYDPNPDFWISVLYKKLVGNRVVPSSTASSNKVRLYTHCTPKISPSDNHTYITVFGMNLGEDRARIRIGYQVDRNAIEKNLNENELPMVFAFELTGDSELSKNVYLNDVLLKLTPNNDVPYLKPKIFGDISHVEMPPLSVVFWVITNVNVNTCK